MKRFVHLCLLLATAQFAQITWACQPLSMRDWEDTPDRVETNFRSAEFVVLATVTSVANVKYAIKSVPDYKMDAEKVTFRIDEAFKGERKAGETFEIYSYSSCARSVKDLGPVPHRANKHRPANPPFSKQWIIYYTPFGDEIVGMTFEITSSTATRPIGQAAFDITYLRSKKNAAKN